VEVMVLDVDEERRRISLGMKQVAANPWETFAAIHKKGDKVSGQIKSITDFGIFIGLDGGIDGLVHLSDISWNTTGEDVVRNFKKGDNLDAVVLAVDPERERISLGVKQLEQDPFGQYMAANPKGSKVEGVVKEVDAKGATIELADGIEGYVAARDVANERVDDATQFLKVGDKVEAKFVGMDRKGRTLQLSIKAKDDAEMREVLEEYQSFPGRPGQLSGPFQGLRPSTRVRNDQIRVDRNPGAPTGASEVGRCRSGGEVVAGNDGRGAGWRGSHRDPRVRQFFVALPAAAAGAQPQDRGIGRTAGQACPAFQAGQGTP
ncbi:MAG: ribosomal protein, partial [Stenotrophomonas rhizophila]|nr:ribosomal protein [Stenotrophomonas rhizophila]